VKWANGLEGGFLYGRDAVREYWTNQFKMIQAELETLKFETDEKNRDVVTVHQIIRDLQGNVLADATIQQIFTIEDGLISVYEIGESETIQEMIQRRELPINNDVSVISFSNRVLSNTGFEIDGASTKSPRSGLSFRYAS
jgi:hypothetical protein